MDYLFLPTLERAYQQGVYNLLVQCDRDFVPPLSARTSTRQMAFSAAQEQQAAADSPFPAPKPQAYFQELLGQVFFLAVEDGAVCGFLSFIEDYQLPYLPHETSVYVSTVCTDPARRRQGIASALYGCVERYAGSRAVTLRTWSTNTPQLKLLERRGYRVLATVPNDREPGIDSIYLAKQAKEHHESA